MFNALIRTHHITSRKKVAALKSAAKQLECYALLRSGGAPGVMFVQGDSQHKVQSWVETVRNLRYKDFQLCSKASLTSATFDSSMHGSLEEVSTLKDMAAKMEAAGLSEWWRKAMGFAKE
jgi:hypothetical protein